MRRIPRQIAERLPAAADLFADKGLNDSKIEDVAAATGVPKATLYYYFAGKEGDPRLSPRGPAQGHL